MATDLFDVWIDVPYEGCYLLDGKTVKEVLSLCHVKRGSYEEVSAIYPAGTFMNSEQFKKEFGN